MIADKIKFKGHRCFKSEWVGFEEIKPINVIIGRNNTGKSHLLDLVEALCSGELKNRGWEFMCEGVLDESELRKAFREDHSGGELGGNFWRDHGSHFLNRRVRWLSNGNDDVRDLSFESGFDHRSPQGEGSTNGRLVMLSTLLRGYRHHLFGQKFRRLFADRDVRQETPGTNLTLGPDGGGSTNIIRRYIVTSNPKFPREIVQVDLLRALNLIFAGDGKFTEINVKQHDEGGHGLTKDHWEIFLTEDGKGQVPLSRSGSGLKTVLLVLLNLLVVPHIESRSREGYVFAFEELENNVHPALLRRLLQFIESYVLEEKARVFLTTHSSAALDLFGLSPNAQLVHVTHDGVSASASVVSAHFDKLGVISELGAKPSDLLQANGIIWVEGPSDCIYLNRWLDLYSGGKWKEGRDYQCAFYGGSLLARTQFTSSEEAESELVNLFRVNPNIVVVCDGDRAGRGNRVKDRVRRIRAEVNKIPRAYVWVTQGREIENYLSGAAIAKALEVQPLSDPGQFELFFPRKGSPGNSYVESRIKRKSLDKMDLAVLSAPHLTRETMLGRFDWENQMKQIVQRIEAWNG